MSVFTREHAARVRILYKTILKLHRGMPLELRALGDQYIKDEFRRHKDAEADFVPKFMSEWTNYAVTLAKQLGRRSETQELGLGLTPEQLHALNEEQIAQLYELFQETQKPRDPDNPLGNNPNVGQQTHKDS